MAQVKPSGDGQRHWVLLKDEADIDAATELGYPPT